MMAACEQCGEPTFEQLCSYCTGERVRPANRTMTFEQWQERVQEAAKEAWGLVDGFPQRLSPGQAALALMLAAKQLTARYPELPSFEWYARQVAQIEIHVVRLPRGAVEN
jgi:hypothetical protein